MTPDFWTHVWEQGLTRWHRPTVHPMLVKYIDALGLKPGARIFLPLCGKSVDMPWLLEQGYRVAGAELVESAVVELFETIKLLPTVQDCGSYKIYSAKNIDIYVGDIFDLNKEQIGPVDAVFDRAALVALPPEMRVRYAPHLAVLSGNAPQLLVRFEYDQTQMSGPPFSVSKDEVEQLYRDSHSLSDLSRFSMPPELFEGISVTQKTGLLSPHKDAIRP